MKNVLAGTLVRAVESVVKQSVELFVLMRRAGEPQYLLSPELYWQEVDEGATWSASSFSISREAAQGLMDDLYRAGIRPTEQRRVDGQIDALTEHLNTLKSLTQSILPRALRAPEGTLNNFDPFKP